MFLMLLYCWFRNEPMFLIYHNCTLWMFYDDDSDEDETDTIHNVNYFLT